MKIELTQDEAKALVTLLDAAVKSMGLQAAEAAVFFAKKIDAAFAATKEIAVTQDE